LSFWSVPSILKKDPELSHAPSPKDQCGLPKPDGHGIVEFCVYALQQPGGKKWQNVKLQEKSLHLEIMSATRSDEPAESGIQTSRR
jgi:hypothetical protein